MTEDDELLRTLPKLDAGPGAAERIRALAHAELDRRARSKTASRPVVSRMYRRVEPALVAAVAASYLLWAVGVVVP
jgi:hypothetical protein